MQKRFVSSKWKSIFFLDKKHTFARKDVIKSCFDVFFRHPGVLQSEKNDIEMTIRRHLSIQKRLLPAGRFVEGHRLRENDHHRAGRNKCIMKINAIFFIPSTVPLTPEGGTMVDEHADVRDTMVPPFGG